MSTEAKHPAITPIPVQVSEHEFTEFILPHLSMPKRSPKCKLGYHQGSKGHRHDRQPWLCVVSPSSRSRELNGYGAVSRWSESPEEGGQSGLSIFSSGIMG
jgi:hypothetical protein